MKILKFNKKSLTLVEVVVAMVILVSVIAGLLATFTAGKRFALEAKYRLQAANIARGILEDLKDDVREDTWHRGSPLAVPFEMPDHDLVLDPITYKVSYKVEAIPNSVCRKVTVTVKWTPPS